jgi:hypothetical protein
MLFLASAKVVATIQHHYNHLSVFYISFVGFSVAGEDLTDPPTAAVLNV